MKIFCNCNSCSRKVYLASEAKTRYQLSRAWGINFSIICVHCRSKNQVHVNLVRAESTKNNMPIATTIGGGLLGILAGPLGIIIGLAAGGISGGAVTYNDNNDVKTFNNNYL